MIDIDLQQVQSDNGIVNFRIAMRIARDELNWLKQSIEQGRQELRKAYAKLRRERRAA